MINDEIPGFCPRPQLRAIEIISENVPDDGLIVEVGSLFGRSAYTWASSSKPSVSVYCVDPWDGSEVEAYSGFSMNRGTYHGKIKNTIETFRANLGLFSSRIIPIQEKSPLEKWDRGNIDVVYVDGDHEYLSVCKDLEFWFPYIKKSGVLCGDDFNDEHKGVIKAVTELSAKFECQVFRLGKFWAFLNSNNKTVLQMAEKTFLNEWNLRNKNN